MIQHGFLLYQVESILYCSRMWRLWHFVAFVALCGTLWHFVAFCTFWILLDPFVPFGSFCVLVTDTSLNVSFSISVVAKYQIQNRDFSKCQFVPKMTKTS
jgi:hypothetical protein